MSIQEGVKEFSIKIGRIDLRCFGFPPIGFLAAAVMKSNTAELAVITEHERALLLKQHEMITLRRSVARGLHMNFAGHAEMNSEPVVAGEFEEHPFPASMRTKKVLSDQILAKRENVGFAKDAIYSVQVEIDNPMTDSGIPLFAKPLDLGQLGHRGN